MSRGRGVLAGALLSAILAARAPLSRGDEGRVTATDQFRYSYGTTSRREIAENWLDATWQQGGLRAGVLLDHQAPSEEGLRANAIRHRFVAFARPHSGLL